MTHYLKTLPAHFNSVKRGNKRFEIRNNSDRGFQKGEMVILCEYFPETKKFSGAEIMTIITYVTNFEQKPNMVVFGFNVMEDTDK